MALLRAAPTAEDDASGASPADAAATHLRRCTFRRIQVVRVRPTPAYDVSCLYLDRSAPVPLGDVETARRICETCTAARIFRPDED